MFLFSFYVLPFKFDLCIQCMYRCVHQSMNSYLVWFNLNEQIPGNMKGVPSHILATSMMRYKNESRMKAKQAVTMMKDTDLQEKVWKLLSKLQYFKKNIVVLSYDEYVYRQSDLCFKNCYPYHLSTSFLEGCYI